MAEILPPLLCGIVCISATFVAIIGVVVLLAVNHKRIREKTAVHPDWPTVSGRVTTASVEESVRTGADEDTFYYPAIEFEYTVGGQVYTSKQAVGKSFNVEFIARKALAHYPPGTEVTVSYNPEKPDDTRLLIKR